MYSARAYGWMSQLFQGSAQTHITLTHMHTHTQILTHTLSLKEEIKDDESKWNKKKKEDEKSRTAAESWRKMGHEMR